MSKALGRFLLWAILMTIPLCFFAQAAEADRQADHEALRALLVRVTRAANAQDMKALRACFAKEFVFTAADQATITSEEQLVSYYAKMFSAPTAPLASITVAPEAAILTSFVGPDVGYCYGTSKDTYQLKAGGQVTITSRWTAMVVRENGEWKVLAAHAGIDPLKNPLMDKAISMGYKLGAGGFLLGLIAGMVGMLLLAKAKKAR